MTPSLATVVPGISGAELDAMRASAAGLLARHGFTGVTVMDPEGEFGELAQPWLPPDMAVRGSYDKVDRSHFIGHVRGTSRVTPAESDAARFTGTLWAAIRAAGGPHAPGDTHRHLRGAYDPAWLASLPLPDAGSRAPAQPVALLDDRHAEFERHTDPATLAAAYTSQPRTQVLEDIAAAGPGTWYRLAALYLTRLSRSDPHVTCSVFTSRHGNQTFGAHKDTWYGAAVQVAGAKDWTIGSRLLDRTGVPVRGVTTRPGDILLLPKCLAHIVATPASPGHSVHLAFAICRDRPDRVAPRSGEARPISVIRSLM